MTNKLTELQKLYSDYLNTAMLMHRKGVTSDDLFHMLVDKLSKSEEEARDSAEKFRLVVQGLTDRDGELGATSQDHQTRLDSKQNA